MSYIIADYTDQELHGLLGFSTQPSDRELEAKIIQQIKYYQSIKTPIGTKLAKFFQDTYEHFFDIEDKKEKGEKREGEKNGNVDVKRNDENNVQLTQTLTYTQGTINPILKETYTRTISIDSQYRDLAYSSATDFTLNFTETLKDVVSLKLYAVQIPNTWYTISKSYGSNYFFLKPIQTNYGIIGHDYKIAISPGNYTATTLLKAINTSFSNLPNTYTDVSFGSTSILYDTPSCKSTIHVDIQKVYNESNYQLNIGSSLATSLGIDTSYTLWTVNSSTFTKIPENTQTIDNSNNQLIIERYIPTIINNQITSTGISFEQIIIDLSNGSYSQEVSGNNLNSQLLNHINEKLQTHPKLIDSSVTLKTNSGKYYWQWKLKLNRFQTIPSSIHSKIHLIVPNDPLWTGTDSDFGFPQNENEMNILNWTINDKNFSVQGKMTFTPEYDEYGGVYIDPILYSSKTNQNDIILSISGQYENISSFVTDMNIQLERNTFTYGSYFMYNSTTKLLQFHYNVNKIYTSRDYKLVFYDLETFQKCSSHSSYKNSTIDNTLGWILGFHTMVEYPLQYSYIISVDSVQYYLNEDISLSTGSVYEYEEYNNQTNVIRTVVSLTGDTVVNIYLFNYLMVLLDDYNQNHLNDGLVTITKRDNFVTLPSYANRTQYHCDPVTGEKIYQHTNGNPMTQKQYYSVQQIIQTQNSQVGFRTSGPFIKDMFAVLPVKVGEPGTIYTEFGGTLQAQARLYFGPVNISRMSIQLINDKGDVLDLNGANWSIQLICEQLYQKYK